MATRSTTTAVRVGTARVGGGKARKSGGYGGRTESGMRGGLSDQALGANNRVTGGRSAPATGLGGTGATSVSAITAETHAAGGGSIPLGSSKAPMISPILSDPLDILPAVGSFTKSGVIPAAGGSVATSKTIATRAAAKKPTTKPVAKATTTAANTRRTKSTVTKKPVAKTSTAAKFSSRVL